MPRSSDGRLGLDTTAARSSGNVRDHEAPEIVPTPTDLESNKAHLDMSHKIMVTSSTSVPLMMSYTDSRVTKASL